MAAKAQRQSNTHTLHIAYFTRKVICQCFYLALDLGKIYRKKEKKSACRSNGYAINIVHIIRSSLLNCHHLNLMLFNVSHAVQNHQHHHHHHDIYCPVIFKYRTIRIRCFILTRLRKSFFAATGK